MLPGRKKKKILNLSFVKICFCLICTVRGSQVLPGPFGEKKGGMGGNRFLKNWWTGFRVYRQTSYYQKGCKVDTYYH